MTIYYLYIKTHNKTGLKYLGQTKRKDPHKYKGSGKYWLRHLKKHGEDYTTEILHECQSVDELKEKGLYYSRLWNVAESNEWANLMEESGDGAGTFSKETLARISESLRKVAQDPEWQARQRENARKKTQNPEFSAKMSEVARKRFQDPEHRAKNAEKNRKLAQDPEWRARHAEAIRKRTQDPEWQAKNREAAKKRGQNPVWRAKVAAGLKARWAQRKAAQTSS